MRGHGAPGQPLRPLGAEIGSQSRALEGRKAFDARGGLFLISLRISLVCVASHPAAQQMFTGPGFEGRVAERGWHEAGLDRRAVSPRRLVLLLLLREHFAQIFNLHGEFVERIAEPFTSI
jgi:hypothetical protein